MYAIFVTSNPDSRDEVEEFDTTRDAQKWLKEYIDDYSSVVMLEKEIGGGCVHDGDEYGRFLCCMDVNHSTKTVSVLYWVDISFHPRTGRPRLIPKTKWSDPKIEYAGCYVEFVQYVNNGLDFNGLLRAMSSSPYLVIPRKKSKAAPPIVATQSKTKLPPHANIRSVAPPKQQPPVQIVDNTPTVAQRLLGKFSKWLKDGG